MLFFSSFYFLKNEKEDKNINSFLIDSSKSELDQDIKIGRNKETQNQKISGDLYTVLRVIDGDTIDVSINGENKRLRLIGINTPETVDPRKPVECFGKEASEKAKSILEGNRVYLEYEMSQGDTDKYGRLLRYVFLEDGTNFNLMMIKEGYAYEYTYNLPYKYQKEFKDAQKEAEKSLAGLWGEKCNNGEKYFCSEEEALNAGWRKALNC